MTNRVNGDDINRLFNSIEDAVHKKNEGVKLVKLESADIKKIYEKHLKICGIITPRSRSGAASNCALRNYDRGGQQREVS